MRTTGRLYLYIIIFSILLVSGCSHIQRLVKPHEKSNDSHDEVTVHDSLEAGDIDDIQLKQPIDSEEILHLSEIEKLDSTAQLIEYATDMLDNEQFTIAGYWFALAKMMISSVHREELGELEDYYRDLVLEINSFYTQYVAGVDVLPRESPPEAIIAGIDVAVSDSGFVVADSVDVELDSLGIDIVGLTRPEVIFDSTGLKALLDTVKPLPSVPMVQNKKVMKAISFFQNKGREVFTRWLERAGKWIPIMTPILEEEGLPQELVFLSMIESGFNPKAYSYAHASGPWQFISSTGRIFGLETGWWYDERRDPIKSTRAAAQYLKKLHTDFDDWYLAMAAYNCGEGKVKRHVRKYGTNDFWELTKLPRQTRNYVPTYIAAAMIAQNPTEYGFNEISFIEPETYDSVLIKECVDLVAVAKIVGTDEKTLGALNPSIVRWCTPPDRDETWLYIPMGSNTDIADQLAAIPPEKKRKWVRHRVRSGEALSTIARRYGTTVRAICDVKDNKISNQHRIRAGKELLIPVPSQRYRNVAASAPQPSPPANRDKIIYTVRKGDNLSSIAQRYGASLSSLRHWNKLYRKKFIYPGQKLTIYVNPASSVDESVSQPVPWLGPNPEHHIVKKGETAWDIARLYGVSLQKLLAVNNLSRRGKIRPGDKLILPEKPIEVSKAPETAAATPESGINFDYYIVKSGDNFWDIARETECSIAEIKKLNGFGKSNKIKPGDKLKIPTPQPVDEKKIRDDQE